MDVKWRKIKTRLNPQAQAEAHKDRLKPVSVLTTSDLGAWSSLLQSSTHTPCPGVRKIPPAREPGSAEGIVEGKGKED